MESVRVRLVHEAGREDFQLYDAATGAPIADVQRWHAQYNGMAGILTFTVGPAGQAPWAPGAYVLMRPEWELQLRFRDEAQFKATVQAALPFLAPPPDA